ncbi:MAG: hypothetical protein JWQ34_3254 [Mucilaginibacter sp.]|uniref:hypothetical protein n=1 Tax=Mucilaginibacter sp. TaxID=1882438 RepID=UPI002637FB3B|nr:hypothetical protein [Mucilaginibacter sp.]MDB5005029.1 hypothetical protein [Mucilaginibacter sp.]
MSTFSLKLHCDFDHHYSVIIQDDGRVAYAYLYEGEDIIGDVWLYNQQQAPAISFWRIEDMPFLNPTEYLSKDASIKPIQDESEVRCEWTESLNDGLIEVGIYIRDKFIASIASGSKPGWSVLVAKDGPLAYVY